MQTRSVAVPTSPLRAVRQARGRSLRSTAREAGIDPAHLSRIERGLAQPSLPSLRRLAQVLGLVELEGFLQPYLSEPAE